MTTSRSSRRQLVSSDEAKACSRQHTTPCGDCPWARRSLPGWLGGESAAAWIRSAHGDEAVNCHTTIGPQCAGLAIYRSNVAKSPRDPNALRLKADRKKVFATPVEFMTHHGGDK